MRKIEQWMIAAIKAQQGYSHWPAAQSGERLCVQKENTKVETSKREDGHIVTLVFLHGNLIAQHSTLPIKGMHAWGFKMCGWPTPTTKSRINAIADEWGYPRVHTKKGKHFTGQKEVTSVDWF